MKKGRARSCDPCSRPSVRTRNDLFGELDLLRHRLFHTAYSQNQLPESFQKSMHCRFGPECSSRRDTCPDKPI